MTEDAKLAQARRDAAMARERLIASAHMLQARVAPARLANDALAAVGERATGAADTLEEAAKRKPAIASGIMVGLCLLFLRKPIARLVRHIRHRDPPPAPRRIAARPRTGDQ